MENGEVARGRVLKVHEVQRCFDVVASCTFLIVCVCAAGGRLHRRWAPLALGYWYKPHLTTWGDDSESGGGVSE